MGELSLPDGVRDPTLLAAASVVDLLQGEDDARPELAGEVSLLLVDEWLLLVSLSVVFRFSWNTLSSEEAGAGRLLLPLLLGVDLPAGLLCCCCGERERSCSPSPPLLHRGEYS